MRISVTQKNIDQGVRGSCSQDPVSLALRDAGFERPWVSPDHIAWTKDFKSYSVDTPNSVYAFIVEYDNRRVVYPFEFELEA